MDQGNPYRHFALDEPFSGRSRWQSLTCAGSLSALSIGVLLAVAQLLIDPLANFLRPYFGVLGLVHLMYPFGFLVGWYRTRNRNLLRACFLACLGLAAAEAIMLMRSGTVSVITDFRDDRHVHSWFVSFMPKLLVGVLLFFVNLKMKPTGGLSARHEGT